MELGSDETGEKQEKSYQLVETVSPRLCGRYGGLHFATVSTRHSGSRTQKVVCKETNRTSRVSGMPAATAAHAACSMDKCSNPSVVCTCPSDSSCDDYATSPPACWELKAQGRWRRVTPAGIAVRTVFATYYGRR